MKGKLVEVFKEVMEMVRESCWQIGSGINIRWELERGWGVGRGREGGWGEKEWFRFFIF